MLTRRATDPTEGERARRIREQPDRAQPIFDPTDPRAERRVRRTTTRHVRVPVRDLPTARPRRER